MSTTSVTVIRDPKMKAVNKKQYLNATHTKYVSNGRNFEDVNIARRQTDTTSSHIVSRDPSFACWFLRKALLMLGMKSIPETLELFGERPNQIFLL